MNPYRQLFFTLISVIFLFSGCDFSREPKEVKAEEERIIREIQDWDRSILDIRKSEYLNETDRQRMIDSYIASRTVLENRLTLPSSKKELEEVKKMRKEEDDF